MVLNKIDVLILCGGLGKRLREATGETPKVLAMIDRRPFLDILLEYLYHQGFRRVILCAGYKAAAIAHYYHDRNNDLAIEFSNEYEPLGTGGAIRHARRLIKSSPFFVLNGDSFCPIDFKEFFDFYLSKKALASAAISRAADQSDFGTITIDENQKIVNFKEKTDQPHSKYVNAGAYCFRKDIFRFMPQRQYFSLENDFFPRLGGKKFYGFITPKRFIDIGTPKRYQKAKQFFRKAGWD